MFLKNLKSLIYKADLLISSNSTTILDSLSIGIPVIIIGSRSGLTQNPIPSKISNLVYRISYSKRELLDGINYFRYKFDLDSYSIKNKFKNIRNQFLY